MLMLSVNKLFQKFRFSCQNSCLIVRVAFRNIGLTIILGFTQNHLIDFNLSRMIPVIVGTIQQSKYLCPHFQIILNIKVLLIHICLYQLSGSRFCCFTCLNKVFLNLFTLLYTYSFQMDVKSIKRSMTLTLEKPKQILKKQVMLF